MYGKINENRFIILIAVNGSLTHHCMDIDTTTTRLYITGGYIHWQSQDYSLWPTNKKQTIRSPNNKKQTTICPECDTPNNSLTPLLHGQSPINLNSVNSTNARHKSCWNLKCTCRWYRRCFDIVLIFPFVKCLFIMFIVW